jgi:hypothetical protein
MLPIAHGFPSLVVGDLEYGPRTKENQLRKDATDSRSAIVEKEGTAATRALLEELNGLKKDMKKVIRVIRKHHAQLSPPVVDRGGKIQRGVATQNWDPVGQELLRKLTEKYEISPENVIQFCKAQQQYDETRETRELERRLAALRE